MNERIKELQGQTLDKYFSHTWTNMDYVDLSKFAEKFAELIVKECMEVAIHKDDGMISTADIAGYMAAGRANAAKMIAKHFGVE